MHHFVYTMRPYEGRTAVVYCISYRRIHKLHIYLIKRENRKVDIPFTHVDTPMRGKRNHIDDNPQAIRSPLHLTFASSDSLHNRLEIDYFPKYIGAA
jgi:hypothetical protein